MKIAVTYDEGNIFQHFGHTENFKIYTVEDGKITHAEVVNTQGSGHGALGGFLGGQDIDTLICGGIGGGAKNVLADAGIKLFGGASGSCDDAVAALIAGTLAYNPGAECDHHDHAHGDCGQHHSETGKTHRCGE
ncbi:MAG: NifB/NifX family molybdenum-iron cluster-binding protein [Raoultibacter sp.]